MASHASKKAVTVNTTNKCNLRCTYCMASTDVEQANATRISLDFAKRGIEDAIHGRPTGIAAEILRFFAPGEPTQAIEIVRECVTHARRLKPTIRTELQTNGLFDRPEDTDWIALNLGAVWFSLDGPPRVNDIHRPDEYGKGRTIEIERNLALVGAQTVVGVRCTVGEELIDQQELLVDYYANLGVKHLAFNPIIRPIHRQESGLFAVNKSSMMRFAKGFVRAHDRAQELGVDLLSSLTFNFDAETDVACRSCLPMPQLNPDGSVSSCDMAMYKDVMMALRCFIYGEWDSRRGVIDYDMDKVAYLQNRRLENLPKCANCSIGRYCAGGCAGRVAYQTGNPYDIIPENCAATRYLAEHMKLGQDAIQFTHP
jgi:radical SAM protein with 4Fe4S-binding SPASM domain